MRQNSNPVFPQVYSQKKAFIIYSPALLATWNAGQNPTFQFLRAVDLRWHSDRRQGYSDRKRRNVSVRYVCSSLTDCRLESTNCLSYRETIRSANSMYLLYESCTAWLKSLHTWGKNVYLQNVLYMGTISLTAHSDASLSAHGELAFTHLVSCVHACLMRSWRSSIFCIYNWYAMAFKCPHT